ncbi:cation transport protein-domain-containing protein [Pilaira anomala]|nr:cation transport protein-domain-containing protein [Pilaira anomala]
MDEKNTDAPNKSTNTLAEENNNTVSGTQQGIAFAENIERQREIARRRLEQDRKFEDILQRIAGDSTSTTPTFDNHHNQHMDPESDDEEMKRIMREPIHKSELTRQQRYRLGGAEYRAIVFLTRLVPFYYLFCSLGFGLIIRIYISSSTYAQEVLKTTNAAGPLNEWLFSFFCSMSSFNNLGLSLMDASMVPFQSSPGLLIPVMFLILAGNTAYAIILRLIIWILYKCTPKSYVMRKETFRYLLDHPRRCYTTLFPSTQTKWLLIVLIGITAVEFVSFVALNFWLPVLEGMDWGARILGGLFQSVATRSAGYSVVDVIVLNPGTQIVFIVAMYISVYPVAISMRNSNVYQERALGIYHGQDDNNEEENEYEHSSNTSNFIHRLKRSTTISSVMTSSKKVLRKPDFFVMTQIQRQLTSEICWVICCIFAICVIEAEAIMSISPITIASIIYECVSAFGNVGASVGYPSLSASQSEKYHPLSLPAAIDRAVLLPSEQLEAREQEDHLLRRRNTSISVGDGHAVMFYNRSLTL